VAEVAGLSKFKELQGIRDIGTTPLLSTNAIKEIGSTSYQMPFKI
jgi:hypothetical protein